MLTCKVKICISFQSTERLNDAATICSRTPLGMTGRICLKSPPRTTVIPPNGRELSRMSCKVRLTASTQ
ncbi:hypothetical protein LguiA_018093 [Lonicera macranthoides]